LESGVNRRKDTNPKVVGNSTRAIQDLATLCPGSVSKEVRSLSEDDSICIMHKVILGYLMTGTCKLSDGRKGDAPDLIFRSPSLLHLSYSLHSTKSHWDSS